MTTSVSSFWNQPRVWLAAGLILGFGLGAGPAFAARLLMVSLEFPPLEYTGPEKSAQGAAVAVVREVMRRMGHEIEIRILPWPRSLRMMQRGEADAIFTAYKNPERELFMFYSNEVLVEQVVAFYARKGDSSAYAGDFATLKGRVIGVTSTISYGQVFDLAAKRLALKTDAVDDLDSNVKKLMRGRVDVLISNRFSAQTVLRNLNLSGKIVELKPLVEKLPSYIAFSKVRGHVAMRDSFDRVLREVKRDGSYDRIMRSFGVAAD